MKLMVFFFILLQIIGDSYEDDNAASQLVMFKDLRGMDVPHTPVHFNIRTNFKGSVEFIESDEFKILLNITAPSKEDLYRVHYNYTDYQGSLLLQVFESVIPAEDHTIYYIITFISIVTLIAFISSIVFVVLWNKRIRPHLNETRTEDTSAAPLLDSSQRSDLPDGQKPLPKMKKKKKKRIHRHLPIGGDENVSSEEDVLTTSDNSSPSRRIIPSAPMIPKLASAETAKSSSGCSGSNPASNESLTTFSDRSTGRRDTDGEMTPERRVVRYIKMEGQQEHGVTEPRYKKRSGYYSPLPTSDKYDTDRQTSLKVGIDDIPLAADGRDNINRGRGGHYGSLQRSSGQSSRVPISEEVRDKLPRPSASLDTQKLSGTQVAQLLADRSNENSPGSVKHRIMGQQQHAALCPPENNRSLMSRTPSPKPSSPQRFMSPKQHPQRSNPAKIVNPASPRLMDSNGRRVALTPKGPPRPMSGRPIGSPNPPIGEFTTFGKQPRSGPSSPEQEQTSSGSSCSSPRLVDEAYGTLGSNGGSSYKSTDTTSSCSSVGSANTVIAVGAPKASPPNGHAKKERRSSYEAAQEMYTARKQPANDTRNQVMKLKNMPNRQGDARTLNTSKPNDTRTQVTFKPPGAVQKPNSIREGPPQSAMKKSQPNAVNNPLAKKNLHVTMLSVITVLGLMGGVYSQEASVGHQQQKQAEIQVHITMYFPPGSVLNGSYVVFNKDKDSQLIHRKMKQPLDIIRYDVENPQIVDLTENKCRDTSCPQGCDPNTGKCLCRHGYRLVGNNKCEDVNECQLLPRVCDENAECTNTNGSFTCSCQKGYYGDGKSCRDCRAPCENGTYENRSCSGAMGKQCKDCRLTCPTGKFVSGPCDATHDTSCTVCRSKCKSKQFEYSSCYGQSDRKCKDIGDLPEPQVSNNVVFENRQQAEHVFSDLINQARGDATIRDREKVLDRENGMEVRVMVKEANLVPLYESVDHSVNNENQAKLRYRESISKFCSHPMPSHYELSLILHQGATTKVKYCSQRSSDPNCVTNVGYYMDPHESCNTYGRFGTPPQLNPDSWRASVLCTQNGKLAEVFQIKNEFDDISSLRVDRKEECANKRAKCDSCLFKCAQEIRNNFGNKACNVTAEDADNGESPRLRVCYNCCAKTHCEEECKVYHSNGCKQIRCAQGTVAEFLLDPKFGETPMQFFCHIRPVPSYKLYDIFYSVHKNGELVLDKMLQAVRMYDGVTRPDIIDKHNFLMVHFTSNVRDEINLMQGDVQNNKINAGRYMAKGKDLLHTDIQTTSLVVRPKEPFEITTNVWRKENCDTNKLGSLIVPVSDGSSTSVFKNLTDLEIKKTGKPEQFRIFNYTSSRIPSLYFEALQNESVLEPIFGPSSLITDNSLYAELDRKDMATWRISIYGQLQQCPGYVGVNITDPSYPDQSLFHYDLGVRCPRSFQAHFDIPTSGEDIMEKRFNVELKDSYRSVHIKLYRPAPNLQHEVYSGHLKLEDAGELEITVFTPALACFSVLIGFFTIVLALGYTSRTVNKSAHEELMKRRVRHSWFVVIYVTFRAAYSLAMTLTVLLLILRTINREPVHTLSQYERYTATWTMLQQSQLSFLKVNVDAELQRQNQEANRSKIECETRLHVVHNLVEETKKNLTLKGAKRSSLNSVSRVASQFTKVMVDNLTNNVLVFREEFTTYARGLIERMAREISQTFTTLEKSKWLRPATEIRDTVEVKRKEVGKNTKPLMEWLGLHQELKLLSNDLSLSQFPLPNINDFLAPVTNRSEKSGASVNTVLPQNTWMFEYKNHSSDEYNKVPPPDPHEMRSPPDGSSVLSMDSLLLVAVLIDLLWFIHRMICTVTTARQMLYGCPLNIDCRKFQGRDQSHYLRGQHSRSSSGSHHGNRSKPKQCCMMIRNTNIKVMKTDYVPKLITVTTICVFVYMAVMTASSLLTLQTLDSLGFFDTMIAPVVTAHNLAKTRIKTNAFRINRFEYPFHEELFNVRLKRYQLILDLYGSLYQANNVLQTSEYCNWAKLLNENHDCNCTLPVATPKLHFLGCEFPPISPKAYSSHNLTQYKERVTEGMLTYVNAARQLVADTSQLILIFIAVIVLVETLGGVVWIYLKRFGLIRLKPVYEMDYTPDPVYSPQMRMATKPPDSNGLSRGGSTVQPRLTPMHQDQDDSEDFPGPMWPPKNNHSIRT